MADWDLMIKAWDEYFWEYSLALKDLDDDKVWVRPHSALLSIGELTGHVAYGEAVRFLGDKERPDVDKMPIKSPLIDDRFRYYLSQKDAPVVLNMGAEELASELARVHEACKQAFIALNPEYDDQLVGFEGWTWRSTLVYHMFHVSYHAGQAYSVRHLLGDTPEDN
ncbi:MAG: DUF664 domain-containing protein [Fimbriimonadaceae bacterium]|nr:MAG: DUF664 domain-containing protein [Fimbriimonadaceae bacterium]